MRPAAAAGGRGQSSAGSSPRCGNDGVPGRPDRPVDVVAGVVARPPTAGSARSRPSPIGPGPGGRTARWTSARQVSGTARRRVDGGVRGDAEQVRPRPAGRRRRHAYPPPPSASQRPAGDLVRQRVHPLRDVAAGASTLTRRCVSGSMPVRVAAVLAHHDVGARTRARPPATTASTARSQPGVPRARRQRDVDGGALAHPGRPSSRACPVPGNSAWPLSWTEIVSTRGSSQNTRSTPSPWCASTST